MILSDAQPDTLNSSYKSIRRNPSGPSLLTTLGSSEESLRDGATGSFDGTPTAGIADHVRVLHQTPLTERERRNPYLMHQTLERAFEGIEGRILWRCERETLIVRSRTEPRWEALPDGYVGGGMSFPLALSAGRWYGFSLRVNAVRTDNTTRKRVPIRDRFELPAWLSRQMERGGCVLRDATIQWQRDWLPKSERNISLVATEFRGVLEVCDEEKAGAMLREGVGKGKGFGLGLILIDR